jgi:pilus assembly protein CpaF
MEGELVTTQDLFVFDKTGITESGRVTGVFRATGIRPTFNERLASAGVPMPPSVFQSRLEVK